MKGIKNPVILNTSVYEDIEKHDSLNPLLFTIENTLREEVDKKIREIADFFVKEAKEYEIPLTLKDIYLVGSNVSYNYTKDSDLDVHLVVDTSEFEDNNELYKSLYNIYRSLFNKNYDLSIKGIPVELYIEIEDDMNVKSNGIYSLNNGWIKFPKEENIPNIDKDKFEKEFKKWEDRYFDLLDNSKSGGDNMDNKKKLKEEAPVGDNNQIEDDKIYAAIKDVDINDLIDIPNGDLSILLKD